MSEKQKIHRFTDLRRLVTRLRDDLDGGGQNFVLLYAYNVRFLVVATGAAESHSYCPPAWT